MKEEKTEARAQELAHRTKIHDGRSTLPPRTAPSPWMVVYAPPGSRVDLLCVSLSLKIPPHVTQEELCTQTSTCKETCHVR